MGEGFVLADGEGEYGKSESDGSGINTEAKSEAKEVNRGAGEGIAGREDEMEADVAVITK